MKRPTIITDVNAPMERYEPMGLKSPRGKNFKLPHAPNIQPIRNTAKGRKLIVDEILHARFGPGISKARLLKERTVADLYVEWSIRALNQIAAGRKVKL
jgi:hypothetical protein